MATKDLYENLVRYYEFQIGNLPRREEFLTALRDTFSEEDLRIFFQLPYLGFIREEKLQKKLSKIDVSQKSFDEALSRLIPKGLVDKFQKKGEWGYERAPIIVVLEMSVRETGDSALRRVAADVMNDMIEGAAETIPTKTPYYRVLAVEPVVKSDSKSKVIKVNADIPDPRQVLPIDVISEMIKQVDRIAVSNCYCRSAKEIIGEGCGHSLETCFYFDELAQMKLQTNYAREITYEEAMEILYECEKEGLVHNVSNCEGKIQTLCNCCYCSCAVLKAWNRGMRNTTSPSRFIVALDETICELHGDCVEICPVNALSISDQNLQIDSSKCIGCGLCVSVCPTHALGLELRENPPKIYKDNNRLYRNIYTEAALGLIGKKLGIKK
jgi:Fe-S-cluster-containing hydrogenase component 2